MPATLSFPTAADALAFFQNPTPAPSAPAAETASAPAAQSAGAPAPAEPAAEPAAVAPEPPKPGALARLFSGGALAEVQGQLANALTEANTLRAEIASLKATNATLLECVNLAAARISAQPAQVAAQVADISASLGLPPSALPSAEQDTPEPKAKAGILAEYEAIQDPSARRAFFKANKAAILNEQALTAANSAAE